MLDNLTVILVKTRFPENIGMCARACANMGCASLCLVEPERWDMAKALPLATPKGENILQGIVIYDSLTTALANQNCAWATTARTGGWRKFIHSPEAAAKKIAESLKQGSKTALVFGSEKNGLENSDIAQCNNLVTIPTAGASSLNLAQAVLIILYECAKALGTAPKQKRGPSSLATIAEVQMLEEKLRATLTKIHCSQKDKADYYFLAWHNMLSRACLHKHEVAILMGFCRQMENFVYPPDSNII